MNKLLQKIAFGILVANLLWRAFAHAETYHTVQPAKPLDKATVTMLKLDIKNKNTPVWKCSQVELTKKLTWKNVPASGSNDFMITPTKVDDKE